ncbi:hypothetical protein N657DRAFT_102337 [Parathielavia appendiculata]|uniref:Uncharacterized protein n=1 Tax=Parathielavia appendiculata TaxID=2587402 RepID=A0AAN6TWK4_9PEZI|nr:hypothetical protein N657DRAFT_102337 [Parathielavia appendiculata]
MISTPNLGPSTARPGVKMDTDPLTKAIDEKIMEYALLKNIGGISQEALFCLKRAGKGVWGSWSEYEEYISLLRRRETQGTHCDVGKIEMDMFFAEQDNSSDVRDSQWFDRLWNNEADGWIQYGSLTVPVTTHETITRVESGALESVFSKAANLEPCRS